MLARHLRSSVALLLCALCAVTSVAPSVRACFGYAPPPVPLIPVCFKGYTFGFSAPESLLEVAGGSALLPIEMFHVVSLAEAVPSMPVCPPGPYTVTRHADVECDNGLMALGLTLPSVSVGPGATQEAPVVLSVPGDAGCCTITITSEITIGTCVLVQTQRQSFCIVPESAIGSGVPRLDLRLLGPGVAGAHPGDQALTVYELTNNDPVEDVTVTLTADSRNVAGQPSPFDLSNTLVVSDPVYDIAGDVGDNFPIAFLDQLPPPQCIDLPLDPGSVPVQVIGRTIMLPPGTSIDIEIVSRSWPMCADGSCCQSLVVADALFTDGSTAKACASAVYVVDNAVPPHFAWPGSGIVGQMGPDPLGGTQGVGALGFPFPQAPTEIVDMCLIGQPLPMNPWLVDGVPVPGSQGQFCNVLTDEADLGQFAQRLTLKGQFPPLSFPVDSFFDIEYRIQLIAGVDGVNGPPTIMQIGAVPGVPQGLELLAPGAQGEILLPVPNPQLDDIAAILTHQVVGSALTDLGNTVQVEILELGVSQVAPDVFEVFVSGYVPDPTPSQRGFSEFCLEIKLGNDMKTFFKTASVPLCVADFDGDGDVDLTDFGTFGAAFGSMTGDPNYNADADFDDDGDVDLTDFGTFGSEFGATGC